jgi:hypothetical protein
MRALDRKLDAFAAMLADRRSVAGQDNISRHHDFAGRVNCMDGITTRLAT